MLRTRQLDYQRIYLPRGGESILLCYLGERPQMQHL